MEVDRLLNLADWRPISGSIEARTQHTELPLGSLPSGEELEAFATAEGLNASAVARAFVARHRLQQQQAGESVPAGVPFFAQSWRFDQGPTLLFLTGEVCIDYQIRIKKEHGPNVWPIAYANATPCYIVSKRMLEKGGYEAGNSMFYYGWLRSLLPVAENVVMQCVADVLETENP